jgi:L,D-transpeptidase catalytic domain
MSLLLVAGCGSDPAAKRPAKVDPAATQAAPARVAFAIPGGGGHLALMAPKDGLNLRDRPNGRVIAHLARKTQWGSATIAWAPERRGDWVGVVTPALGNGRIGWLNAKRVRPRMWRSKLSLRADLSDRRVELRRGSRVLRRIPVTIGSPTSPTPTGRFAVTDKLVPTQHGGSYGCCVLALSGHQPSLRPGWAGGDRIAIHRSPGQQTGAAASGGCLRARDRDLERLMDVVPLGTPVLIRA